jgi:hypothetical protein
MNNSTFAAAAADAIDYPDDDDEESSESEEVSDISVAVSSEDDSDEDSDDDDDDDGDTEEAVFLCDARDIQNRTSRCVGTAAMEDRRFCGLFRARIKIVLKVWSMLLEDGLRPKPQEEQAKASALDALFFEGLYKGGTRLLHCWWVEGCHRPKDPSEMGVALH